MEIVALNPSKPRAKKRASKKGSKNMARRRDSKGRFLKSGGGRKHKRSRKYRRNPGAEIMLANPSRGSRVRRYAGRAVAGARSFFGGLGIGDSLRFMGGAGIGIAAAMLVRRKFGKVDQSWKNWELRDYIMAALGGFGAAALARYGFKVKPETSGAMIKGALSVIMFRILQDEVIPMSPTLQAWIGEGGEGSWSGYGADEMTGYSAGDLYLGEGETYVMGEDGQWRGIDESNRVGFGALTRPGSLGEEMYGEEMYGALSPPGSLGEEMYGEEMYGAADPYASAYGRRTGY